MKVGAHRFPDRRFRERSCCSACVGPARLAPCSGLRRLVITVRLVGAVTVRKPRMLTRNYALPVSKCSFPFGDVDIAHIDIIYGDTHVAAAVLMRMPFFRLKIAWGGGVICVPPLKVFAQLVSYESGGFCTDARKCKQNTHFFVFENLLFTKRYFEKTN